MVLLLILSCGSDPGPEFTPEEMDLITSAAGMLARSLAYFPGSAGWSPEPDNEMIAELESLAARQVELWPVFFRAAADTAAKLEQLMIQQQQESQQSQLL